MEGHHSSSDQSSSPSSPALSNSIWGPDYNPDYSYLHFESPELPSPIESGRILNLEAEPQYSVPYGRRPITGRHHFDFPNGASNSDLPATQSFAPEPEARHSLTTPLQDFTSRRQLFPASQNLLQPQQIEMPSPLTLGTSFSNTTSSTLRRYEGTANLSGRRNFMNANPIGRECKFCKNNGEMGSMYKSHVLRNPATGILVCPVLRAHVCEVCGGTGDYGHTRNYCPLIQNEKRLKYGLPISLKMTKRQSDGQVRKH